MKVWFYNHAADDNDNSDSDVGRRKRSRKKDGDVLQLTKAARKRALHPYQVLIKMRNAELCKERDDYFPSYARERIEAGKRPSLLNCLAVVASRKLKELQETNPTEFVHVERITRDYNSGLIARIPRQKFGESDEDEDINSTTDDDFSAGKEDENAKKAHNKWLEQVERSVTALFDLIINSHVVVTGKYLKHPVVCMMFWSLFIKKRV